MKITQDQSFSAAGFQEWYDQVSKELKGASPEDRIYWKFDKAITIPPLIQSTETPPQSNIQRKQGAGNNWNCGLYMQGKTEDLKALNKKILAALQGGMNHLHIELKALYRPNNEVFADLLSEVELPFIDLCLETDGDAESIIYHFKQYLILKHHPIEAIKGSLLFDPIAIALRNGCWMVSAENDMRRWVELQKLIAKELPAFYPFVIDGTIFHETGANTAMELAGITASAHELLVRHLDEGATAEELKRPWQIHLSTDHRILRSIAKIRALRLLWAELTSSYELDIPLNITVRSSRVYRSYYDRYNNVLRAMTETYGAASAGADNIIIDPFPMNSEHDERIYRNIHHLLKEEGHVHYSADPAGGAGTLETLTEKLAKESWEAFRFIEKDGGLLESIESGKIQAQITQQADELKAAFDKREIIITGCNQYTQPEKLNIKPKIHAFDTHPTDFNKLKPFRLAEELEAIRYANETDTADANFLLLKFGNIPMAIARANFISDFLQCGGFQYEELETDLASLSEFDFSIYSAVVLCTSDDEIAAGIEKLSKLNLVIPLIVAGKPADESVLNHPAVKLFIYRKSSLQSTLGTLKSLIS